MSTSFMWGPNTSQEMMREVQRKRKNQGTNKKTTPIAVQAPVNKKATYGLPVV